MTGIITECDSYFITKYDRSLLQNASVFLLQNVTDITQCNNYYKFRQYTAPIRLYILTDPLQIKNFPRVFCHFEELSDDFEIRIILIFRFRLDWVQKISHKNYLMLNPTRNRALLVNMKWPEMLLWDNFLFTEITWSLHSLIWHKSEHF